MDHTMWSIGGISGNYSNHSANETNSRKLDLHHACVLYAQGLALLKRPLRIDEVQLGRVKSHSLENVLSVHILNNFYCSIHKIQVAFPFMQVPPKTKTACGF